MSAGDVHCLPSARGHGARANRERSCARGDLDDPPVVALAFSDKHRTTLFTSGHVRKPRDEHLSPSPLSNYHTSDRPSEIAQPTSLRKDTVLPTLKKSFLPLPAPRLMSHEEISWNDRHFFGRYRQQHATARFAVRTARWSAGKGAKFCFDVVFV